VVVSILTLAATVAMVTFVRESVFAIILWLL